APHRCTPRSSCRTLVQLGDLPRDPEEFVELVPLIGKKGSISVLQGRISRKPKLLVDRREPSALGLDALSKLLHVLPRPARRSTDVCGAPSCPFLSRIVATTLALHDVRFVLVPLVARAAWVREDCLVSVRLLDPAAMSSTQPRSPPLVLATPLRVQNP